MTPRLSDEELAEIQKRLRDTYIGPPALFEVLDYACRLLSSLKHEREENERLLGDLKIEQDLNHKHESDWTRLADEHEEALDKRLEADIAVVYRNRKIEALERERDEARAERDDYKDALQRICSHGRGAGYQVARRALTGDGEGREDE